MKYTSFRAPPPLLLSLQQLFYLSLLLDSKDSNWYDFTKLIIGRFPEQISTKIGIFTITYRQKRHYTNQKKNHSYPSYYSQNS